MRLKSGWWGGSGAGGGDKGGGYSAGKIKPAALVDTLTVKTLEWSKRHEKPGPGEDNSNTRGSSSDPEKTAEKLEGPGLFVFKHREHQVRGLLQLSTCVCVCLSVCVSVCMCVCLL